MMGGRRGHGATGSVGERRRVRTSDDEAASTTGVGGNDAAS